jgi:hypothetical protein
MGGGKAQGGVAVDRQWTGHKYGGGATQTDEQQAKRAKVEVAESED